MFDRLNYFKENKSNQAFFWISNMNQLCAEFSSSVHGTETRADELCSLPAESVNNAMSPRPLGLDRSRPRSNTNGRN